MNHGRRRIREIHAQLLLPGAAKIFVRVLHRKRIVAGEFRPGTASNRSASTFRIGLDVTGTSVELEVPSGERLIPTRVRSVRVDP